MGIKLSRKKRRNFKLSLAYRLSKLIPLSPKKKLKLFLDLSWIFTRLAHEQIFSTDIKIISNEEDIIASFIASDSSVLDIGCGKGYVIKKIIYKTKNITGIDYDSNSIEEAKGALSNTGVVLICDDVFKYLKNNPLKRFDYVILSHVLEHIEEPGTFLQSLTGVAKFFYIEVPDFEATHLNLYRQQIGTDLVYTDADHVSEFDRKELERIVTQNNFKVIKSEFRFGVMKYWCENKQIE